MSDDIHVGHVKFFDSSKGFGFIIPDVDIKEHHVQRGNIRPVSLTGIPGLYEGQEVKYRLGISKAGRPAALDVEGTEQRLAGVVVDFDDHLGEGEIKLDGGDSIVHVHHSRILGPSNQRKYLTVGNPVELEVARNQGQPQATKVLRLDTRQPLERFSFMFNLEKSIDFLATKLAQKEDWDYKDNPTRNHPTLQSYISGTFSRIEQQNRIQYATDTNGNEFACFNTGLVTDLQQEILTLFRRNNRKEQPWDPEWFFIAFVPTSDRRVAAFAGDFPLADYFEDASDLVLDWRLRIEQNAEHIIRERAHRFPESLQGNESARRGAFEAAFRDALRRVRRNYKAAVPQYHRGEIQLLLPLALENPPKVDRALVLSRVENTYRAHTIFPLDWAYRNARLLARPDREWLVP